MKPDTAIIGPITEAGGDMVPLSSQVREFIRASKAEHAEGLPNGLAAFLRVV